MKRLWGNVRRWYEITPALLLVTTVLLGGCSSRGPIAVKGVVTMKQQTSPKGNPTKNPEKEQPHYFLWVETEDGVVLLEVEEEVYRSVAEGEQVCINCSSEGP
jgi:hypothetical protein